MVFAEPRDVWVVMLAWDVPDHKEELPTVEDMNSWKYDDQDRFGCEVERVYGWTQTHEDAPYMGPLICGERCLGPPLIDEFQREFFIVEGPQEAAQRRGERTCRMYFMGAVNQERRRREQEKCDGNPAS